MIDGDDPTIFCNVRHCRTSFDSGLFQVHQRAALNILSPGESFGISEDYTTDDRTNLSFLSLSSLPRSLSRIYNVNFWLKEGNKSGCIIQKNGVKHFKATLWEEKLFSLWQWLCKPQLCHICGQVGGLSILQGYRHPLQTLASLASSDCMDGIKRCTSAP